MTDFSSFSDEKWYEEVESAEATVATTITLTDPINQNLPHCFVGIQQLDAGSNPVVAATGTYTIEIQTVANRNVWEEVPLSPIDATAPMTLNFASNIVAIRAVPSGITGTPVTYKLVLTANGN